MRPGLGIDMKTIFFATSHFRFAGSPPPFPFLG